MIPTERQRNTLRALQIVLVRARSLAYDVRRAELTQLLDVAEYLPALLLEEREATAAFRDPLAALAQAHAGLRRALFAFDDA